MNQIPRGWIDLRNSMPVPISDKIPYAILDDGSDNEGVIKMSSDFNSPTGGTWSATPITFSAEPGVTAVNATYQPEDAKLAAALNMTCEMANITDAPPPLENLMYFFSNMDGKMRFQQEVHLNFGGNNYDLVQIGVLENSATKGDAHSLIEVIDFGSGPYTGVVTFKLFFDKFTGPLNLGVRLESDPGNASSIFGIQSFVNPIVG